MIGNDPRRQAASSRARVALGVVICVTVSSSSAGCASDDDAVSAAATAELAARPERPPADPALELTAELEAARRVASDALDVFAAREVDEPLRAASPAELAELGRLWRAATPEVLREPWRAELDRSDASPTPATPDQRAALERLAATSLAPMKLVWDGSTGTPARIEALGFTRREVEATEVWHAFARASAPELAAIFGVDESSLSVIAVDEIPGFHVVRMARLTDGVPVRGEHLDAFVSAAESPLGHGVLWRLDGVVSRSARATAPPSTWLTEEDALARADVRRRHDSKLVLRCERGECAPQWRIREAFDREVVVDARSGEILEDRDPRRRGGPIFLGSYPPGTTGSPIAVAFRGTAIRNASGTIIGNASLSDGTYSASGTTPWQVDRIGVMALAGGWPVGRVDRRGLDGNTFVLNPVTDWNPVTQGTRNFAPDWTSNAATLRNTSQVVYGWLSYWQHALKNVALVTQVPQTVSYQLLGVPGTEIGFGAGWTADYGPPGSGQANWGAIYLEVPSPDVVAAADGYLVGHEYGHTLINCATAAGTSCDNPDQGASSPRPPDKSTWRNDVFQAAQENGGEMYGALLTELRYARGTAGYDPDWTYGGYFSLTDSFGSTFQDAPNYQVDCAVFGCGGGPYACRYAPDASPRSLTEGGQNLCYRTCTTSADCTEGLNCTTGGYCDQSSYTADWFRNVGARLMLDGGWHRAFKIFHNAYANNDGDRDFDHGVDTWYDRMVTSDLVHRYETTRAVRSVVEAGATLAPRDDFPSDTQAALPITVIRPTPTPTPIWWGNGYNYYPNFEDIYDIDAVMFWGVSGARYDINAGPVGGSPVDLKIDVYRYQPGLPLVATGYAPAGPIASVQTPALADDWYVAVFSNRTVSSGAWSAYIGLWGSGYDDFSDNPVHAYPLRTGEVMSGSLNYAWDADAFKIFVPTNSTDLLITATPTTGAVPIIDVYRQVGGSYVFYGTYTGGLALIPGAALSVAHWAWKVRDGAGVPRAYTTAVGLSCSGAYCDNLSGFSTPVPATQVWGDKFAGRLNSGWHARYSVTLAQNEHASFAIVDALGSPGYNCAYQIDLYGPSSLGLFSGQRIYRWRDGPAATDPAGYNHDIAGGGHLIAPVAGDYVADVSLFGGTNCWYRLFVAENAGLTATARPSWQ